MLHVAEGGRRDLQWCRCVKSWHVFNQN